MIVCLDANCVIYLVELNPLWSPKITARLAILRATGDEIAVSDLARTECLVGPLFSGDAKILADYHAFFGSPTVKVLPITAAACERAAHIRAASSLKPKVPDCLYLATAIEHGCGKFLTNDVPLAMCTSIPVEVIS